MSPAIAIQLKGSHVAFDKNRFAKTYADLGRPYYQHWPGSAFKYRDPLAVMISFIIGSI
jgi:hypothetical protein